MQYITRIDESPYESTVRAEDGDQQSSRWTNLCEGVLIPLGSLFAIFLVIVGVMLVTS